MPKLSRKELKQYADQQRNKFASLIGKNVRFVFGKHDLQDTLLDVKLARQEDMINKPDKRFDEDGKLYTPPSLEIDFSGGQLFFIIEDIMGEPITTLSGICIPMKEYTILFREAP